MNRKQMEKILDRLPAHNHKIKYATLEENCTRCQAIKKLLRKKERYWEGRN